MKKRWAIVRVDNNYGPCVLEKVPMCKTNELCYSGKCPYRYGDTKEQLVAKVKQALVRARIEEDENSKSLSWEQIATRIVEFLGVEK